MTSRPIDLLTPAIAESEPALAAEMLAAAMLFPDDDGRQFAWQRKRWMDLSYEARATIPRERLVWLSEQLWAGREDEAGLARHYFARYKAGTLLGAETLNAIMYHGTDVDLAQRQGTRHELEEAGLVDAETNRKWTVPLRPVAYLWAEHMRHAQLSGGDLSELPCRPCRLREFVANAIELGDRGLNMKAKVRAPKTDTVIRADQVFSLPLAIIDWALAGRAEALAALEEQR